jgi:hypothetical protein
MDSSVLGTEQEKIISYLYRYGDTRETDLITYGVQRLGKSVDGMRKVVDEMVLYGRLERVTHKELEPKVTYVKYGSIVPLELELQAIADSLGQDKVTEREIEAVKVILAKAEITANKKISRKARTKLRKESIKHTIHVRASRGSST